MSEINLMSYADAVSVLTAYANRIKENAQQVSTMPTASVDYVNKPVQFIGTTTASYTHGYFYECVASGGGYAWQNVPVSEGGGGGGSNHLTDGMIAPYETGTATQNYAIGEQFNLNGVLYTATVAITTGATLTPGTNCTASESITEQIRTQDFTSSDDDTTTDTTTAGMTSVATLASGETRESLFSKISKMFLNIRKLWNTIGETAIPSNLGTTVTGAISSLNSKFSYKPVPLIPFMTSNTTPIGEASAQNSHIDTEQPFCAFNGVLNTSGTYISWGSSTAPSWIQYDFGYQVTAKIIRLKSVVFSSTNNNELKNFYVQASNDGSTFTTLTGTLTFAESVNVAYDKSYLIDTSESYRYWRIVAVNNVGNNSIIRICWAQLYGYIE